MKRIFLLLTIISCCVLRAGAQQAPNPAASKDSLGDAARDSILQSKMTYPFLHSSRASGVFPVTGVDELPDSTIDYKVLFAVFNFPKGSQLKLNETLSEAARSMNLHIASGIPESHLHFVVIIYGPGISMVMDDAAYQRKYQSANPNKALLVEMQKAGVKVIACGQSMFRFGVSKEDMLPGIKVAVAARPAISYYQMMGYRM